MRLTSKLWHMTHLWARSSCHLSQRIHQDRSRSQSACRLAAHKLSIPGFLHKGSSSGKYCGNAHPSRTAGGDSLGRCNTQARMVVWLGKNVEFRRGGHRMTNNHAMPLTFFTVREPVSLKRWSAPAVQPVVAGAALSAKCTRTVPADWHASLTGVVTPLIACTVLVPQAANLLTTDNGIALEALRAVAVGYMELHSALCPAATGDSATRIHTLLRDAGLVQRALQIGLALICDTKRLKFIF